MIRKELNVLFNHIILKLVAWYLGNRVKWMNKAVAKRISSVAALSSELAMQYQDGISDDDYLTTEVTITSRDGDISFRITKTEIDESEYN